MATTYYYGDPRMFQGYNARRDENSLLDYWFYPDRNYFEELRKEEERLAEANKKKDAEAKGKGGGSKKGSGGDSGEKKGGEDKEGGAKKDGGKKQPKVIELKVNLCCDSCARKVKRKIEKLDGVESGVVCDIDEKKVIVKASADTKPETVLKKAQEVKKDAVMWPKKETEKKEGGGGGGGEGGKKKN